MKKGRKTVPFVVILLFCPFRAVSVRTDFFSRDSIRAPRRRTARPPDRAASTGRLSNKPSLRRAKAIPTADRRSLSARRKRREKGIFDFRCYQSRDKSAERAENKVGPTPYAHKIGQKTADCQSRHRKRKQGGQNGHGLGNAELDCAEAHKLKNIDERQVNAGYERVVTNVFCDVQLHNAVNSELFFVVCQLNT